MITKCTDCGGELEKGCMMDSTYSGAIIQRYAKSDMPQVTNRWPMKVYETNFNNIRRVLTLRCTKCNKLFLYTEDSIEELSRKDIKIDNIVVLIFGIIALIIVVILFSLFFGWL